MMMMMMMMMNCFCGITDRRKEFNLIPSRDHCQGSSPSRISDTPPTGFQCAQKLSSDLVEWGCAAVIATIPRRHYFGNFECDSMQNKSVTAFVPTAVINSTYQAVLLNVMSGTRNIEIFPSWTFLKNKFLMSDKCSMVVKFIYKKNISVFAEVVYKVQQNSHFTMSRKLRFYYY